VRRSADEEETMALGEETHSSLPWYIIGLPAIAAAVARDPIESFYRVRTRLVAWKSGGEPFHAYTLDKEWRQHLGAILGATGGPEFSELWSEVRRSPELEGLRIGPQTFGIWNDGDPALLEASWRLTRHLRPLNVVETGVARGLTSRIVLEALHRNGTGHLWSIDLPPALDRHQINEIGIAVPERLKDRWSLIEGSSRRHLPGLLSRLGEIDLFIHDSMHTEDNVGFEMRLAWEALKPGGAMIVDDVDLNRAFYDFAPQPTPKYTFVCQSEPLELDVCRFRFEYTGLFGIVVKPL
jgi:predicted O-methyltransferase YrrM